MAITLRHLIDSPVIKHRSVTGWNCTFWRYLPEIDRYIHPIQKDRLRAGARRVGVDTIATHTIDQDGREWLVFEWATGCLALRARTPAEVADVPLSL